MPEPTFADVVDIFFHWLENRCAEWRAPAIPNDFVLTFLGVEPGTMKFKFGLTRVAPAPPNVATTEATLKVQGTDPEPTVPLTPATVFKVDPTALFNIDVVDKNPKGVPSPVKTLGPYSAAQEGPPETPGEFTLEFLGTEE